jgi:hypothetical protein
MNLMLPPVALPCAMLISAFILACWLGNKKIPGCDAIVLILVLFLAACVVIVIQFKAG